MKKNSQFFSITIFLFCVTDSSDDLHSNKFAARFPWAGLRGLPVCEIISEYFLCLSAHAHLDADSRHFPPPPPLS